MFLQNMHIALQYTPPYVLLEVDGTTLQEYLSQKMDSTKKLVDDLFAMKMFHCAHCEDVLQIPVMLVENVGNVCHTCYDSIKAEDKLVALENTFVNTILEKVEVPCENESKGCSERIPYEEIQEHKQQCLYQSFHCIAPEECSWTGCLKDFEIHYRDIHKLYQLQSQNDHFSLGTSLGELRVGVYLLQTSCGDFFLSVNKTEQDVAFVICDIGESINDFEYNFSVTFGSKDARKFSSNCKITDWKSFVTANHAECYNKTKVIAYDKCSNESKINLESLKCMFQDDIVSIKILLNVKNEYISNECILENFHCKNCQFYLKSEIYSCACGHNFCGPCKNKNRQNCGHPTYRSLALENIVKKVRVSCIYKDSGCLVKMPANNLNHEFSCPYSDLNCTKSGCGFTGTPALLINHLQHIHLCTSQRNTFTTKTKRHSFYLIRDNLLFEVDHNNSFPNCISWTVNIIGNTEQAYYYQIAINFAQINMTFKVACYTQGITETGDEMNIIVKLTSDMLQQVGYDGSDLRYGIQILKC